MELSDPERQSTLGSCFQLVSHGIYNTMVTVQIPFGSLHLNLLSFFAVSILRGGESVGKRVICSNNNNF